MNAFLRRIAPVCAAASVGVILAVAVLTLALSQQAAIDYAQAVRCPASPPGGNCYTDVTGRITQLNYVPNQSATGRLGGYYTLVLTDGQQQWSAQISARSTVRPLFVGQDVDARVWRSTVMQITTDGWTATTYANPQSSNFAARWILAIIAAGSLGAFVVTGVMAFSAIRARAASRI